MSWILLPGALLVASSGVARAQADDLEPRAVGGKGVMSIGVSGFIDKPMSSEDALPFNATAQIDVTRFLTNRIAVRGGLIGTASFGGDEDAEASSGAGTPALHALGGALFYWTPQKMASVYAGGEYRAQLTHRPEHDAGTVLGIAGVQAAVSSRTSVFAEGGYGVGLTRSEDDARQTRIVGEIGFRIKF